jgi:hypothetical protein
MKQKPIRNSLGRMLLHLLRGGDWGFRWSGIAWQMREGWQR